MHLAIKGEGLWVEGSDDGRETVLYIIAVRVVPAGKGLQNCCYGTTCFK